MPFTMRVLLVIAFAGLASTFWHEGLSARLPIFLRDRIGSERIEVRRRVVAVADLHGDLEHAHNVLRMAKLIDGEANWSGGHDVLVSTGDIVDRGDDTIALYQMFQRLRAQAQQSGGEVRNCIGNHEMMNALLDWRYVTQGDLDSFGGAKERRHQISDEGWIGRDWLANFSITHTVELLPPNQLPAALQGKYDVPSANFVHGGIHPTWAAEGLESINEIGHSLLQKALANREPDGWLPPSSTERERGLYDQHGPLWYRGFATDAEKAVCDEAHQSRTTLGVRHLIMGHTPHLSGFVVRCQGAVLLIDTGISRAYGGEQSALIIDTAIKRRGRIRKEEETITALYRGRLPKVIDVRVRRLDV